MIFNKKYLLSPGPTVVPENILLSGAKPVIHHRTPEFSDIFKGAISDLKKVFYTDSDVYILASSGTGAMEFALVNLCSKGDKVLVVVGGKFGERWLELARVYGLDPVVYEIEWGKSPDPDVVADYLRQFPDIKVVFTTLFETSTGTIYDIKAIAERVRKSNALLVVDAVSGILACELKMDEWGIDVVVAGSQKAFMLPPGIAFVAFGERAIAAAESSNIPSYYFSFKAYRKSLVSGTTPYTPAVTLIVQLREALRMLFNEGLENVVKRHTILAEATRAGIKAMGLELFSSNPGNVCTAVRVPDGVDGKVLLSIIRDRYRVIISGGQGKLKGKILRIAHLGYVSGFDVIIAIAALDMALRDFGFSVEPGKGVAAVETVLRKESSV